MSAERPAAAAADVTSVDAGEVRRRVRSLNVWKRGDERAPHKPLLLLYALGRLQRGEPRQIPYEVVDEALGRLLEEFGPPRKSHQPEYPFWRLERDGVWRMEGPGSDRVRETPSDPSRTFLIEHGVSGGFAPEVEQVLTSDPELVQDIANTLLVEHFPRTYHEDILAAAGLDLDTVGAPERCPRDPDFRIKVITAYEYACGVCGFSVRLADTLIGLEAAHVKWHQAGGPDVRKNGIALCSLHHKLFDRGAFTISPELAIQVSERVNGATGLAEWLLDFHARSLRRPQRLEYEPGPAYLGWHAREVFHGPARAP